jgi:RNA polymerase sigma-70 factor (ECF subfamily)
MVAAEREFTAFYDATWARTVTCVYAVTGELGAAKQAAQEAYVRAWRRWSTFSTYVDPAAGVRHMAVRRATRGSRGAPGTPSPATPSRPSEVERLPEGRSVALVTALRGLPEVERRALVLHYLAGFSIADIAAVERCAEKTITGRLAHGRSVLVPLLGMDPSGVPSHG